jgi:APA family basic amino acid/polyamine antiporter
MSAPSPDSQEPNSSDEQSLIRALGFWTLAASVVNVTIGGSIFALPGTLASSLGVAAPLAFILGALLFVPITLCFAAAGSRVISTGGPYRYVVTAFGPFAGFMIAIFLWISSIAGSGSLAAILADQVAQLLPGGIKPLNRAMFIVATYALLFGLNLRGIRIGATAIVILAAAKVLPLLALTVLASGEIHIQNFRIVAEPNWTTVGSSLVIVVFAYSGIETALAPSGEIRNPAKIVPLAAIAGVAMVVVLYVGLQCVAQGVLGAALAGNDAPLAAVAQRLAPGADQLMLVVAFVSLLGCLQGDLVGSSRLLLALAGDGLLPALLKRLGRRNRAPGFALALHALACCSVAVIGSFTSLALISGGAFCFVYIACCAAAWRLQSLQVRQAGEPLSMPLGALFPVLGIASLLAILATLQSTEWRAITWTVVGIAAAYTGTLGYRRIRRNAKLLRQD